MRTSKITILISFILTLVFVPTLLSAQGLLAHWKFDEGTGSTAMDSVGGYVAEFMENADWAGSGKIGSNAIYMGGGADYVQTDLLDDLQFSYDFTICAWFSTEDTFEGQHHMIWIGDSTGNGYGPEQESHLTVGHFNYADKLVFSHGDGLDSEGKIVNIITEEDFYDTDVWHHIAGVIKTVEGDTSMISIGELYLDGVWQVPYFHEFPTRDTVYYEILRENWNRPMRFGVGGALGSRHFAGMLDDVQIYDRALTAEEIAVVMTGETVVGVAQKEPSGLPRGFSLANNYPNPFNPSTTISYTVASTDYIRLNVYDLRGRHIERLVSAVKTPGTYSVNFDAGDLPGGVYLYELQVGNASKQIKKMALVK
jgi:hypothetical protein